MGCYDLFLNKFTTEVLEVGLRGLGLGVLRLGSRRRIAGSFKGCLGLSIKGFSGGCKVLYILHVHTWCS